MDGWFDDDPNRAVYNAPAVAAHYARLEYLSACEQMLFETYLRRGMKILDVGVGGGRTTPYLAALASHYVGIDYAPAMISACREKFPDLEFHVGHADDLKEFDRASFDSVVLAFNSLDYVIPDSARAKALAEFHRVLKPGGILIVSSHNPRAIFHRPSWNSSRLDPLAERMAGGRRALKNCAKMILAAASAGTGLARCAVSSAARMIARVPRGAFWRGEGYMTDPAHGGLLTHYATPEIVQSELTQAEFRLVRLQGNDYPLQSWPFVTDWYYYVATLAGS
jgi:SAM-dependent methyltransferase